MRYPQPKALCLTLCFLCVSVVLFAQPNAIPYQAVARNNAGIVIANQNISLRFSIHDVSASGTVVYGETQTAATNSLGLFTVNIGQGTATAGTFAGIDWSNGTKFLQVELDVNGGSSYTNMGTQQMMSVPYALYAANANNPGPAGATGPQGPAGSLAAYGDGSAGALNVSAFQTLDLSLTSVANFNLQYTTINVAGTLIVPSGVTLRATGNVTISGTITVLPGTSDNGIQTGHPGVAISAASYPNGGTGLTNMAAAQLVRLPFYGGGSGCRSTTSTGGDGGGSFRILAAGSINVSSGGFIRANGVTNTNLNTAGQGIPGAGGGAGGVIVLLSKSTLTITGNMQANGGNGSNGFDGDGANAEGGGGGGAGGIIVLLASSSPALLGSVQVNAGAAGSNAGASATINAGGGGGACGGNGGNAGSTTTTASAGSPGKIIQIVAATPETFTL